MRNRSVDRRYNTEFILCYCGCGQKLTRYDKRGYYERKYIHGHQWLGKKHSEETKQKMIEGRKGEKNANWKANNITNGGLHKWLRDNLPKPKDELCEICHIKPIRDVANITTTYNREFKNWAWFCAKCHKYYDNIIERNLTMKGKYPYRDPKTGRFIKAK